MQNLKSGSRITKFVSLKIYQTFTFKNTYIFVWLNLNFRISRKNLYICVQFTKLVASHIDYVRWKMFWPGRSVRRHIGYSYDLKLEICEVLP